MFTFITGLFSLFCIALTGWTITTYFVKENSQKFIKEELGNIFNICKMFFLSLKSLLAILATYSFSSFPSEANPAELNALDDQPLKFVQPIKEDKMPIKEDEDNALSSFSPELIEVITEEEEKVA